MKLLLFLLFLFFITVAFAQKLPKTQEGSVRAPANAKMDGKIMEWGNLQAYNSSIGIYFTLANDDDKLYLVIKAIDQLVIRKIIAGGISLTINSDTELQHNKSVTITYPLFGQKNWPTISVKDRPMVKDSNIYHLQIDSFIKASNQQLGNRSKEIKVLGDTGLEDTLVSVYNQEGIKAVSQFDRQINYVYELAIPFKYLGLSFKKQLQFRYKIQLNGSSFAEGTIVEEIEGGTRTRWYGSTHASMEDMQFIRYPTNLWGNYTLVKK
jgi:hypothetical protein